MPFLEITEGTPEWHDIRRKHIGGSEVAGLFGVQPDFAMSHFTLHQVKAGRIPPPPVEDGPGSRVWFGHKLEPAIARLAAEMYGWEVEKGGYAIDATVPGMGCSLDYVIKEPGAEETRLGFHGPGVLQLKNSDWLAHRKEWTAKEPPLWILLQLQHEIACSQYGWGCIVCLVGGNELPCYRYAARPRIADAIRDKVRDFWADVRRGRFPSIDKTNSTAEALRATFPSVQDEQPLDMRGDTKFADICGGLLVAQADLASAIENYQGLRNELEAMLEGHTFAECEGFRVRVAVTPATGKRRETRRVKVREVSEQ